MRKKTTADRASPADTISSVWDPTAPLRHGGRLRQAAAQYGIPLSEWLDLSTGINPNGWCDAAAPPPAHLWSRLPEDDDGLEQAAAAYYGSDALLPVAGSQAAIQALPRLRERGRVGVISPGYDEHERAWSQTGNRVYPVPIGNIDAAVTGLDVLVLIHPNNPTGACFTKKDLLRWHADLAARGGWLVVDEAFIDATPEQSMASVGPLPGLILLRSLGKFFGLAGARLGFVLADAAVTRPLAALLGPWTIANPCRWLATHALADQTWQAENRERLIDDGARLATLLTHHGLTPGGGTALFQWVPTNQATELHERLARTGILTRLFNTPAALRFGLPARASDWERLEQALP